MSAARKSRNKNPRTVIIGAGFAGLTAAQILSRRRDVDLVVIDRSNHHLFQPLLYQVATAGLSPADISMPIRAVLRNRPHTEVIMASVSNIDLPNQNVILDSGKKVAYDYLLVATGARHGYFGHPEWEAFAPGLKSLDDATDIRRRILLAFESAEVQEDPIARQALLRFVLVGGGPTGIEMAGAIAELARHALVKDFHHIRPEVAEIILIEAGPRLLRDFHEALSHNAKAGLEKLGVKVRLNTMVTGVNDAGVQLADEFLATKTVIWAAGVFPSRLGRALGVKTDAAGRVLVNDDLSVPGHPCVYVAGDLAAIRQQDGSFVPAMSPGAMQGGRQVARNILLHMRGQTTQPFSYVNKGTMATVGRARAVAEIGSLRVKGFVAWLLWLFVHIYYLIGFRNRLLVLFQWFWSYVTFKRGTRLITGSRQRNIKPANAEDTPPEGA